METITGHTLRSADGEDIGQITDVVGADGLDVPPRWVTVKTGLFAQRLVPYSIVVDDGEGSYIAACTKHQVKHSPKVPVHFEPHGEALDDLREYYSLRATDV